MTKNKIKKLYSFIFIFIVLGISMVTYATVTGWSGGTGTEADPYLINNATDFVNFIDAIRDTSGTGENENLFAKAYYKQTADIDFSGLDSIVGLNTSSTFTGTYDGQGYLIKNITVNAPNGSLFGVLGTNGVIKNFGLQNATINHTTDASGAGTYAGGLLRVLRGGTLENIYIDANVNSSSTSVTRMSGVVAYFDINGIMKNVYYNGELNCTSGKNPIKAAILTGKITDATTLEIADIYYPDNLEIALQGSYDGAMYNIETNVYPYSTDMINSGELLTRLNNYAVTKSTTTNMLNKWVSDANGRPILSTTKYNENDYLTYLTNGTGSESDPYIISNKNEFRFFIESLDGGHNWQGKYINQINDIDFSNEVINTIDGSSKGFNGFYNGQGHVIKNLTVENRTYVTGALFGKINDEGVIKNFGLDGGTLYNSRQKVGGFLSGIYGGTVENFYSTMNIVSSSSAGYKVTAGIAMSFERGYVKNAYYGGTITIQKPLDTDRVTAISEKSGATTYSGGIYYSYWDNKYGISDMSSLTYKSESFATADFATQSIVKLNNYVSVNSGLYYWTIDSVTGLPKFSNAISDGIADIDFLTGDGTASVPYLINNLTDFRSFFINLSTMSYYTTDSLYKNKYFNQTSDIDFTGDALVMQDSTQNFAGVYDGLGHTVNNIYLTGSNGALFGGLVDGGIIRNFGLKGGTIEAVNGNIIGTLARRISNGSVINCYVTANIIGTATSVSGLVGFTDKIGNIENSYFAGNITGTFTEKNGLTKIGNAESITVNNCTSLNVVSKMYTITSSSISNYTVTNNYIISDTEFKLANFVESLNKYVDSHPGLYYWANNEENGYPDYYGTSLPILGINNISVDIYSNNAIDNTNDRVSWYYDSVTNEYYLLLPKAANRSSLIIYLDLIVSDSTVTVYNIENEVIGALTNGVATDVFSNSRVIIKNIKEGYPIKQYIVNVKQSTISSIYINLDGGNTTFDAINADSNHETEGTGTSLIIDNDGNILTPAITSMKGRGNSSWERSKKPYQLKFDSKISMLGMKSSKTWLLLASYNDGSLGRSYLAYKFANDLGISYSTECEPADVYVNGQYQGSYLVTSKVQQGTNRVEIGESDYLMEIDNATDVYQITTSKGYVITVKNPDLEKYETQEEIDNVLASVKSLLDNIEAKLYSNTVTYTELSQVIDLESFAKYYWVQELFINYDAMVGSSYLYYQDGLLHIGPIWDMDNTLNRSYVYADLATYYILNAPGDLGTRMKANWYRELMKRKDFSDLVDKVFLDNIDLIRSLKTKASDYVEYIRASAEMNYVKWNYAKMIQEQNKAWIANEINFTTAANNFVSNVVTRINWYLSEYDNLLLNTMNYTTTDKKGNEVKGVIDLSNNTPIILPANVNKNATITLQGVINENTNVSLGTISLVDGAYNDKVNVAKAITDTTYKGSNNNYYNVTFALAEPEVSKIEITTNPNKISYIEGQLFDKTGMVVTATYTDETSVVVTDYVISNTSQLTVSDSSITITYQEKTTVVDISVVANTITGIEITTNPTKLEYIVGELFNKTGMVVTATYLDGSVKIVTNYTVDKIDVLDLTDTLITISYEGKSDTLNITVVTNNITSIAITTNPTKISYIEGQSFDKTGMVVTATYLDGSVKEVTNYTVNKTTLAVSDTEVIVDLGGKTATISITVVANNVTGIAITTNPTKISYIEGQSFDKTGMVVTATYLDGSVKIVTNYTVDKTTLAITDKVINVSLDGKNAILNITVAKNSIVSIAITTDPTKMTYLAGETFDKTGMIVKATYLDGTVSLVTNYTVDKTDYLTESDTTVTVTFEGKTTNLTIVVNANNVTKVEITHQPDKLIYYTGQLFDKKGMIVKVTYQSGLVNEVSNYVINKTSALTLSDTVVTISFGGRSTTLNITINQDSVTSFKITKLPNKLTYIEGHRFDTTGMVATATYASGVTKKITNYTISNPGLLTTDDKIIKINFDKFSASVSINVSKNIMTSIKVTGQPNKVIYNAGDVFDKTGMIVSAVYLDGTVKVINDYTIDKTDKLSVKDTVITLSYNDLTTTLNIQVLTKVVEYEVIEGKDQTYKVTDNKENELSIKIDADYTLFESVSVNGVLVDNKYFTVIKGSTIIKFTEEYLSTLKDGTYEVTVKFSDGGIAKTNISIADTNGLQSNIIIYIIIAGVAIIGAIVGIVFTRNKRRYS